jgi:erythronate-4-phosphate dehydrogenase
MGETPRIVADAAIPHLAGLSGLGGVEPVPAAAIDRGALRRADVLLCRSITRVDASLLAGTPVRFVGSATIGTDHVDLAWLAERGIAFAHAPGCNAEAVAEYVIAAIYHAAATRDRTLAEGPVGVVGLGHVGRRVARHLHMLGRPVLVCDPPLQRAGAEAPPGGFLPLDELLARARISTLHVPLMASGAHPTRHLLDAPRMERLLERDALLVQTSRGGVIDETPLCEPGTRGRAVIDTWEGEPALRVELLAPDRGVLVATPHVAGYSVDGKWAATRALQLALAAHLGRPEPAPPPGPDPPRDPIVCPAGLDPVAALAAVLTAVVDLPGDDRALRAAATMNPRARAAAFARLRDGYALRHQFTACTVRGAISGTLPAGLPLRDALSGLGFEVHA